VGRPEVLIEEALTWTVISRPYISATRGLARWTGTTDKVVREITGPTGGSSASGFLWTRTRGVSSAISEERESMSVGYSDSRTQNRSTPFKELQSLPSGGQEALALVEKKVGEMIKSNAVLSARISERAQKVLVEGMKVLASATEIRTTTPEGRILAALDPGLDVWAEYEGEKPSYVAYPSIGRRAWSLAVMCGLRDVVLSMEDIAALTGLSKRGAQALVKRMGSSYLPLVWKIREGRSVLYAIKWHSCLNADGDDFDHAVLRDEIRKKRASKDMTVQQTSARRGTGPGYLAFLHSMANAKREQYLADRPLPVNASEEFKALVAEGDEMKLWEYFKTQEEGVSVPASPAALEAPLPAPQAEVVRQPHEPVPVTGEALRDMMRRIAKMPA
jgi:hypothetical protein